MPKELSNIIQYFRSCYQADARDLQLMNFFGNKIEDTIILKDADLLTGKSLLYSVDSVWGEAMNKSLALYRKEKALYAFSLFLVGKYRILGKSQNVVAPLIFHPLELEQIDEVFYLKIKEGHHIFNPFFFQLANSEGNSATAKEEMYQHANSDFIQFDDCVFINDIIQKHFSNIDTTDFLRFPDLFSEKDIKNLLKIQKGDNYVLVPAAGVGLMKKSFGNRGIYNELHHISQSKNFSFPLSYLFNEEAYAIPPSQSKDMVYAPVQLSHAQAQSCRNASGDVSIIIGPPGTGKSFTVAALACDAVAKGKTVLITSKNNQAVNVIADKIEKEMALPDIAVRAGRKDYLKILKGRIEDLLYFSRDNSTSPNRRNEGRIKASLKKTQQQLSRLEKKIAVQEKDEIHKGDFLTDKKRWFYEWRKKRIAKQVQHIKPLHLLFEEYTRLLKERNRLVKEYLQQQIHNAKFDIATYAQADLKKFYDAIRSRTGARRESLFNSLFSEEIYQAFPIWLVNFQDTNKVIPLVDELFDLVIIDEASQCDIASAIPILQRGKRAVIVGDPKQLRHISFLSNSEQSNLRDKFKLADFPEHLLDYRNMSILDLALERIASGAHPQTLTEHYRSQPDIIAFSNRHFYNKQLKIMTGCPATLHLQHQYLHITAGKRTKSGYNKVEAEEIIEQITHIIAKDAGVAPDLCHSIGVLSPFRGQVNYIQKSIERLFSIGEIEKHRILVGTPHSFQGEERDVMLISFTIDFSSNSNIIRYLETPDVFNVSITRAKNLQRVYLSCPPSDLPPKGLLHQFVSSIQSFNLIPQSPLVDYGDQFMNEVIESLGNMAVEKVLPHHQVAGLDLDIVIIKDGKTKVLDLLGYPGAYEGIFHLEHYRTLSRIGIPVYPISYSHWTFDHKKTLEGIQHFLA